MKNAKMMLAIVAMVAVTSLQRTFAVNNFELFNKSNETIEYFLNDESNNYIARGTVFNDSWSGSTEDAVNNAKILGPINLTLVDPRSTRYFFKLNGTGVTKYVTWNPAKSPSLYPQTGPMMGWKGVTESGLPLNNNIKANDIKALN